MGEVETRMACPECRIVQLVEYEYNREKGEEVQRSMLTEECSHCGLSFQ